MTMRNVSELDADPEWVDEYDPDEMEETFRTFRSLGWTTADIKTDPKYAELYGEWLKTAPPEEP